MNSLSLLLTSSLSLSYVANLHSRLHSCSNGHKDPPTVPWFDGDNCAGDSWDWEGGSDWDAAAGWCCSQLPGLPACSLQLQTWNQDRPGQQAAPPPPLGAVCYHATTTTTAVFNTAVSPLYQKFILSHCTVLYCTVPCTVKEERGNWNRIEIELRNSKTNFLFLEMPDNAFLSPVIKRYNSNISFF